MELEIWHYAEGKYKVYTNDSTLKEKLSKGLGLKVDNFYSNPIGWDFTFDKEMLPKVKALA